MTRAMANRSKAFTQDSRNAINGKTINKAEFYAMAGDNQGADLLEPMNTELMDKKLSCEQEVSLEGNGEWFDIHDLRTKYEHSPARLSAIEKYTRRW